MIIFNIDARFAAAAIFAAAALPPLMMPFHADASYAAAALMPQRAMRRCYVAMMLCRAPLCLLRCWLFHAAEGIAAATFTRAILASRYMPPSPLPLARLRAIVPPYITRCRAADADVDVTMPLFASAITAR